MGFGEGAQIIEKVTLMRNQNPLASRLNTLCEITDGRFEILGVLAADGVSPIRGLRGLRRLRRFR